MTEEEILRLNAFELRLRQLLSLHKELKRKNIELEQQLIAKQDECEQLNLRYQTLETAYTNLKNAKIISLANSDAEKTKLRLATLVREVESCIDLLTNNEMYE
ncbi:MAG: hypothetical protein LBL97_02360 [Prevotellaceae bacterium]|jgi:hypothetical protein|nr:hypothetical protein [Prevotellaceae bacterium]